MKLKYLIFIIAALALIADGKKKRKKKKYRSTSSESLGDSSDSDVSLSLSRLWGSYESRMGNLDLRGHIRRQLATIAMQPGHFSVICSPFSALKPIGMLVFGAEGRTETEMLRAIGVGRKSSVHRHFKKLLSDLGHLAGLHMATRIYFDKRHRLRSNFKQEAINTFGACIEQIDLKNTVNAAREIDSWIHYHTNKKITTLLNPEDIRGADIVIVDAIYFWGKWKYPFQRMHHGTFYGYSGSRAATLMTVTNKFRYGKSHKLNAKIIEIPYKNREMKLVIILPDSQNRKLSSILDDVRAVPNVLNQIKMSKTIVKFTLPKFTVQNTLDMAELYKKVGLHKMFTSESGLTRVGDERLFVDKAFQKVAIVIDDEGTEATGGLGAVISPFPKEDSSIMKFTVDRPFLFFIIVYFLLAILLAVDSRRLGRLKRQRYTSQWDQSVSVSNIFDLRGDLRRRFAFEATLANPTTSVICSPLSALLPLGKLALGASGATERELNRAIGYSNIPNHFSDILKKLSVVKGIHLDIASQVYVSKKRQLLGSYQKKIKRVFSTGVDSVDMNDPQGVSDRLNNWVEKQTHGKIKELISAADVSPSVSTILVNAVYFSGKWAKKFKKVKEDTFFGPQQHVFRIPMMTMTDYFPYGESKRLDAQVINIPYEKKEVFFTIILPRKKDGLHDLLNQLKRSPELLNNIEMDQTKVNLTMPKFKIESEFDLRKLYELIGLREIFSRGMSHMVIGENLVVDKAIQKAMIEVTEEGTTAAAASAIIGLGSSGMQPPSFNADHSFAFFINIDNQQIFAGIFTGQVDIHNKNE